MLGCVNVGTKIKNMPKFAQNKTTMRRSLKGFFLAAIAAAAYGTNPLFALPLYDTGLDAVCVIFFRYLLAIPLLLLMMLIRKRSFHLTKAEAGLCLIEGVLVSVSSLTLFYSYTYMEVGLASTLLFIYPLLVTVIMSLFFRERPSALLVVCLCVVMFGVYLLNCSSAGSLSTRGSVLVGISATTYALYMVVINRSRLNLVPTLTSTFYILLFGMVSFVVLFFCDVKVTPLSSSRQWLLCMGIAALPTAFSFICTTRAIQHIGSTFTAILGALEPATAVLIGVFVFGERLEVAQIVVVVLIILAVTVVVAGKDLGTILLRVRRLFPPGHMNENWHSRR